MGMITKKPFILCIVITALLAACGGNTTPSPEKAQLPFNAPAPPFTSPAPSLTALGDCGALPGHWEFSDLTTNANLTAPTVIASPFDKAFRKSWGGTTTAHAVWKLDGGDKAVWNEGRRLHVDADTPLTTIGMIHDIALTGTAGKMTAILGTERGVVIADITKSGNTWTVSKQTTVEIMGAVRSVATTALIVTQDGPLTPLVFMVANESVMVVKLDDLRAGFGCVQVAYQAKDHRVDPSDAANKRTYKPVKVVADVGLAAFLTASRPADDFANAAQFKSVLQKEWASFQSTAHLIDLSRQTPVVPLITTMGDFDRFLASDIALDKASAYLFGSRYTAANPGAAESGIASYSQLTGTPISTFWTGVPANLGGDFRLGRVAITPTTAYVRGLDRTAKVDSFLSGPTQQKWTVWPTAANFDYVRGVAFRFDLQKNQFDPQKPDNLDNMAIEIPRFVAGGPKTINWNQMADYGPEYASTKKLIGATATDVTFLQGQNQIVHQHLKDDGSASFSKPTFPTNSSLPRLFHVGNLLFLTHHSSNGPHIYVYKDDATGIIDTSSTPNNPAIIGFGVDNSGKQTNGISIETKAVAGFEDVSNAGVAGAGIGGSPADYRIDDIQEINNALLPLFRHFAMLIHTWNGQTNIYRVIILQMDLAPPTTKDRTVEIQGCSDFSNPGGNASNNISYGKIDDQPRFMGPLKQTATGNGEFTYEGAFQHYSATYNVWRLSIKATAEQIVGTKGHCKTAGELTPVTDATTADSLAAYPYGSDFITLHTDGTVRWPVSAKTVQYLDIGKNILGAQVTVDTGQVWAIANQYITRMDTTDGFHPATLFTLDGANGTSCPSCQFTDSAAFSTTLITTHPERGVELYDFTP